MQPSSKYTSTEYTYAGGFVYKATDDDFDDIFGLDDELDMSVSYTTPINSNFNQVNMGGWNSTSASAYVTARLRFRKEWTGSGGTKYYSNVNGLGVSKSPFASSGNVTVVFSKGDNNKYYFGKSPQASATQGAWANKLITDFEVNKVVFKINLLTGWTKADFEYFIANGTLQDNDGYNITPSDFMANPSNYYIRTFNVAPVAYWDGSTWKGNNLGSSPNIHINFLINTDKVSGICAFNKHHYDAASGTGSYGVSNVLVYNSTANNTTAVSSYVRGAVVSELVNVGSGMGGFVLDKVADPFELEMDIDSDTLQNMCDSGISGAQTTLPAHDISWCNALRVLKYDSYTMSYDSGSSGPTHPIDYRMRFCTALKGEYVYKLFAYAGVYFYTGSLTDLIDSGATPTNMKVSGMTLGEMNSAGQTTGNWINPNQMDDYVGPNKDGSIIHPNYNPQPPAPPTNPWDVDPEIYGWSGGEVSGMVKYYLLTSGEMSSLQSAMASNANWTIDYLNCVVSCFVVPNSGIFFDAPIPTTVKFKLDNATQWDTGVSCKRIQGTKNKSGGTIDIPRLTNTFYDFEPYSDYSVYIPFCGRIPIKGNVCLGHEIKVTYYPDVPTCSLTAVVTCGGATLAIAKGSFGTMTPITSNGSDRKTAAVIGDVAPIITGIGTGIVGVALGNPLIVGAGAAQALGGIMGGVKETVQSYAYSTGSTGDSSFFSAGTRCYYYANYPVIDDVVNNSMFGHSVGYLCNEVGKLETFHGFTMCANPHVTFSASSEEREEIERLLSMGVIL